MQNYNEDPNNSDIPQYGYVAQTRFCIDRWRPTAINDNFASRELIGEMTQQCGSQKAPGTAHVSSVGAWLLGDAAGSLTAQELRARAAPVWTPINVNWVSNSEFAGSVDMGVQNTAFFQTPPATTKSVHLYHSREYQSVDATNSLELSWSAVADSFIIARLISCEIHTAYNRSAGRRNTLTMSGRADPGARALIRVPHGAKSYRYEIASVGQPFVPPVIPAAPLPLPPANRPFWVLSADNPTTPTLIGPDVTVGETDYVYEGAPYIWSHFDENGPSFKVTFEV